MSGKVKVGTTWKSPVRLSAKVGGTWRDAKYAYVKVAGSWVKWFTAVVIDNFNRTTSGSLGTATSGSIWSAIRGTWYADGANAKSDDAATSYPIAAVEVDQNIVASVSVNPGTGLAFWVTDSGSWWAATSAATATPYSYTGDCGYCGLCDTVCSTPSAGTYPSCNCGVNTTTTTGTKSCSCPNGGTYGGATWGDICITQMCGSFPCVTYAATCTTTAGTTTYSCKPCDQVCSTPGPGNYPNCNCSRPQCTSSGTTYDYYLRLIKSVGGAVSQVGTDVALTASAAAIAVTTVGDAITVKAYSDAAMTTQTGSTLVSNPTSPTKGTKVGIIKAPTSYGQSSVVDDFMATS